MEKEKAVVKEDKKEKEKEKDKKTKVGDKVAAFATSVPTGVSVLLK